MKDRLKKDGLLLLWGVGMLGMGVWYLIQHHWLGGPLFLVLSALAFLGFHGGPETRRKADEKFDARVRAAIDAAERDRTAAMIDQHRELDK